MKLDLNLNILDITKSIALIAIVLFVIFRVPSMLNNYTDKVRLDETEIIKIAENVVRVRVAESNKDLKNMIEDLKDINSRAIEDALKNKERIEEVATIVGTMGGNSASSAGDVVYKDENDASKDLYDTVVYSITAEKKKIPIARVFFSPNVSKDEDKWGTQAFPLDYHTTIVESVDEEGVPNRRVELYVQNDFVPEKSSKKYPLKIKDVHWVKGEEPDKTLRFHTRLGFSGIFGIDEIYPALDISFLSYGRTKRDMDWRFVDFTIGGTRDNIYFGITPVSYNLHPFLPFIENTFLGVNASMNMDREYNYGLSLSIPF